MERGKPKIVREKPKEFYPQGLDGREVIESPQHGTIVEHTGWAPSKNLVGYPCDVYIVKGTYVQENPNARISNWWTWKKVTVKNGKPTLGPEESGYGAFRKSKNEYDIKVVVKSLKQ